MADQQHGAPGGLPAFDVLPEQLLALLIQRCFGFIQQQQHRVGQVQAGQ